MADILYGNCEKRGGSRAFKKLRRAIDHRKKINDERMEAHREAIEEAGGIIGFKAEKALSMPAIKDDLVMTLEKKDDALNRVVNHAHQRNPRKRW